MSIRGLIGGCCHIHEEVLCTLGPPIPRPNEAELVAIRVHDLPVDEGLEFLDDEVRYLRHVFDVEHTLTDLVAHIDAHDRVTDEGEEAVTALHSEADRTGALCEVQVQGHWHRGVPVPGPIDPQPDMTQ